MGHDVWTLLAAGCVLVLLLLLCGNGAGYMACIGAGLE
jgi:hypothetical protein